MKSKQLNVWSLLKPYRRELKKIARRTTPFDDSNILEYIGIFLKYQREYFKYGKEYMLINDEERIKILNELEIACKMYEELMSPEGNMEDYIKLYKKFFTFLGERMNRWFD